MVVRDEVKLPTRGLLARSLGFLFTPMHHGELMGGR